jgi:hypothetical protein
LESATGIQVVKISKAIGVWGHNWGKVNGKVMKWDSRHLLFWKECSLKIESKRLCSRERQPTRFIFMTLHPVGGSVKVLLQSLPLASRRRRNWGTLWAPLSIVDIAKFTHLG